MHSGPTFGLLVPCKNGAPFLRRLFESVHAQTRPFDEIWLFDDGSTDGSGDLACQMGARVIRSDTSLGPSAARNRLIQACESDWLHFHDADDTMSPNYLERVSTRVHPDLDLIVCDMIWIEDETGLVENRWTYDSKALAQNAVSYLIVNTIGGINGLYRRKALVNVGGFDETLRYWEDMDLNIRLSRHGSRAEAINENLVTAHRRRASYSNTNLGEVWRVKLDIMERLLPAADPELRNTIATEAETIATRQAGLGRWADIPMSLVLARSAGGNPPTTNSFPLRILKYVLPDCWTFRLQHHLRNASSK